MIEIPDELKVAQSLLTDVAEKTMKLRETKSDSYRAKYCIELIQGDLKNAQLEIEKAEAKQFDVADISARAQYAKGLIARTAYTGMVICTPSDVWAHFAADAFNESIACLPTAESYYQLGLVYADMYRWGDAISALQQAAQSDDEEIRITAKKAMVRVEDASKVHNAEQKAMIRREADKMSFKDIPVPPGYSASPSVPSAEVAGQPTTPQIAKETITAKSSRSKTIAGILGILFGGIGIHRFYLGYTVIGIAQIVVTLITLNHGGFGGLWGFVEGILIFTGTISKDADGNTLQ